MTDYNWDQEYKDLYWSLRSLGLNPDDISVQAMVRVVFDAGWSQGYYKGAEHGYDKGLAEYYL